MANYAPTFRVEETEVHDAVRFGTAGSLVGDEDFHGEEFESVQRLLLHEHCRENQLVHRVIAQSVPLEDFAYNTVERAVSGYVQMYFTDAGRGEPIPYDFKED